ncbi:MAG: flavin reductase family protein [Paracoccaceae bacterium]
MFYRPGIDDHGLPHNPFKAIISPRPIGWISTLDENGTANLAPYSFFNAIADSPPMVMFSSTGTKPDQQQNKDSVANIRASGAFVVNIVSDALKDQMNATSAPLPSGVDEFERARLTKAPCREIAPPYVAQAPAALECRLFKLIELPGQNNTMVIGTVVGIHLSDNMFTDGIFDITKYKPLARLGYMDYAVIDKTFQLARPK